MKVPLFAFLVAATILHTVGCGKGTPQGYHLDALFTNPQNLQPGDPVMMAGLQIGHIDFLSFDPTNALTRVQMHIERSVVVKTDSTATINTAVSPGRSSIVLDGGSSGAPAAYPGTILMTREKPGSGKL